MSGGEQNGTGELGRLGGSVCTAYNLLGGFGFTQKSRGPTFG